MSAAGEATPTSQVAAAATPPRAMRFGRPATKIDTLLLLLTLFVFIFGAGPNIDYSSVVLAFGGAVLLWLVLEWTLPLSGRLFASPGWLPSLTQADVLILVLALVSGLLILLPLIAALAVWACVSGISWLRGRRDRADVWFHRAAIFASFVAIMVANEASKVWLYSGALGVPPSLLSQYGGAYGLPTSILLHGGFHLFIDGSIELGCVLLMLMLAWTGVREGHDQASAIFLAASLPVAALVGWASTIAIVNQQDFGYEHTYAWLLTLCWVLTLFCVVLGRRAGQQ